VLPNEHILINDLWKLFATYGLIAVAVSSVIENLVGVNYYFPGAVVILTAMALTAGTIPRAIATFFTILIASSIAHLINFAIGRSFRKPNEAITLNKFRPYLMSYWHPYFAAVNSFNAGTQNISFQTFLKYFVPSQIGWNLFWGIVMFSVGSISGQ